LRSVFSAEVKPYEPPLRRQWALAFTLICSFFGQRTFEGCTSLTDIIIPAGVTEIEEAAFKGCTALESASIPDSVTYIDQKAFRSCTSLSDVGAWLPGVVYVGRYAFESTNITCLPVGAHASVETDNPDLCPAPPSPPSPPSPPCPPPSPPSPPPPARPLLTKVISAAVVAAAVKRIHELLTADPPPPPSFSHLSGPADPPSPPSPPSSPPPAFHVLKTVIAAAAVKLIREANEPI